MTQQISAAVVGLGVHGRATIHHLLAAGIDVKAAADPFHTGKRLGDLVEAEVLNSIEVASDIASMGLTDDAVDIVVLTAKVDVSKLTDLAIEALGYEANVITIVEDAFDLERFAPSDYMRLDTAARAAGRSFLATGSQDVLWAGLVLQMSSQLRDLREINIKTHLGVDGYPAEFLTWCGIGNTHEQFKETAAEAATTPSVFGAVLPVVATKLGLTITNETRDLTPVVIEEDLYSETFQRDIAAGNPVGRRDIVTLETAEGIKLSAELQTTAMMNQDEFSAIFDATPRTELTHRMDAANLSVDATLVNRIPDVIAAAPGVVRAVDLPTPYYRHTLQNSAALSV